MLEGMGSGDETMGKSLPRENFGKRLRKLREERSLSIARLAQKSGITQGYLSQIEAGKRPTPGLQTLIALATALRVTLDELADFDVESVPQTESDSGTTARLDALEQLTLRIAQDVRHGFEEIRKQFAGSAAPQSTAAETRRPRGPGKRT